MTLSLLLVSLAAAEDAEVHPCANTSLPAYNSRACYCVRKGEPEWYAGNSSKNLAPVDTVNTTTAGPYEWYGIDESCFDVDDVLPSIISLALREQVTPEYEEKAKNVAGDAGDGWFRFSATHGDYGLRGLMSGQQPYQTLMLVPWTNGRYKIMIGQTLLAVVQPGPAGMPYEAVLVDFDDDGNDDVTVGFAGTRWVLYGPLQAQTFYPPQP